MIYFKIFPKFVNYSCLIFLAQKFPNSHNLYTTEEPFLRKLLLWFFCESCSRSIKVYSLSKVTSKAKTSSLKYSLATHELPRIIVMDDWTYFTSNKFKIFCRRNVIKHIVTAPYHQWSNGPAKRAVQIFKSPMKQNFENSNSYLITSINCLGKVTRIVPHRNFIRPVWIYSNHTQTK